MGSNQHQESDRNGKGDRRLIASVAVNGLLTLAQIAGGVLSGSLALIADALHNLSDAVSLVITLVARRIARRPPDKVMTFGYGRVEVVAALINYTSLILIGFYLAYEAVLRMFEPREIEGWTIVIVAGIALVVDAVTALLTYTLSEESMNVKAAFLHNMADVLGSVAVIVAGSLILLYDWRLVDPLVTLLIAGYVLWQSVSRIGAAIRILVLGSPPDISTEEVVSQMRGVDGVRDIHHLHVWQMQEEANAVEAHVVIDDVDWEESDGIKKRIKSRMKDRFGIRHATLEVERYSAVDHETRTYGHPQEQDRPQGRMSE